MSFDPKSLPSQTGRTFLVTGANSGIGFQAARLIAERGGRVLLACRDEKRGQEAAGAIKKEFESATLEVIQCDLSSLESVRHCANTVERLYAPLSGLICNAGVMAIPYRETADGFEMQFGTNHLGHFALAGLLFDDLAEDARVVCVSSIWHMRGSMDWDDLMGRKSYGEWRAYAQSKLANLLFAFELDRRSKEKGHRVLGVGCHPGYASTNLQTTGAKMTGSKIRERFYEIGNSLFAQSAEAGAWPTVYAALSPDVHGGDYIGPSGPMGVWGAPKKATAARRARNPERMRKLWEVSEELTKVRFLF